MRKAVINFASGAWYPAGQARLAGSIERLNPGCKFIGFSSHEKLGCPPHLEVPYAFKTHCLNYCRDLGMDMAIYADASIYAVGSWEPIWDIVEKQGYYMENAGHWVGTWTKDSVLKSFGITRDQAMKIPMFTAGFTALNFRSKLALKFLKLWHERAQDGDSFIGSWTNRDSSMSKDPRCKGHRHDMSVGSIIAHNLGMKFRENGVYLSYIGKAYKPPRETTVAYLKPC